MSVSSKTLEHSRDNFTSASLEAQLLIDCALPIPSQAAADRIHNLKPEDIDWQLLFEAAQVHAVLPTVYQNLKKSGSSKVPANAMEALNIGFIRHSQLSLQMLAELKTILGNMEAVGIDAVPFKGPYLAERFYNELLLRTFCDLDIWVAGNNVAKAIDCLRAMGYKPCNWRDEQLDERLFGTELFQKLCHEYTFERRSGRQRFYVDLHWHLLPPEYFPVPDTQLMQSIEKQVLWASSVSSFSDEMTLLTVTMHGCKHGWSQLSWIADTAQIIKQGTIDWTQLNKLAENIGATHMLLTGLYLARTLLDVKVPPTIEAQLRDPAVTNSGSEIIERLTTIPAPARFTELQYWLYVIQLRRGLPARLSLAFQLATRPSLDEWIRLKLPVSLYPLYFVLRPINLLLEHGPRILRRLFSRGYDARMNVKASCE